jgi:hypothetical protein
MAGLVLHSLVFFVFLLFPAMAFALCAGKRRGCRNLYLKFLQEEIAGGTNKEKF